MKKIILLLLITVFFSSLVTAGPIAITTVNVSPSEVEPGETISMTLLLENQGDEDIKNVRVNLDLVSDSLPFVPIGSSAQKTIDEIESDESRSISFTLVTDPEAQSQLYKVPLVLDYEDNDKQFTETSVIGIKVKSTPVLEVALEESTVFVVGETGEITIRFVNKGLSDIKFLTVTMIESPGYEIISPQSFYVGNIEPDDFETVGYTVNIKEKINFIPVKVEFSDANNEKFTQSDLLKLNIYTPEEAKALGLTKTSILPTIIASVVAIIVLFFIIRYIRKKRKAKKLGIGS